MRRRCPVCAQGGLFHHWVRMVPRCPQCGFHFRRDPGQWLGSWFINVCLAQTVAVVFLIVSVGVAWPAPPNLAVIAAGLVAAVAVPVAAFPVTRTLWCAIDLAMRPLELADDVAPGYELEADLAALRGEREP
jgi:uncharacterized protein (DUF983 family)